MGYQVQENIQAVHHTGFIVKDLDRSLDFYVNKLGMKLQMRWIETAEQCDTGMGVPGSSLELAQLVGYGVMIEIARFIDVPGIDTPLSPRQIGVGHVSFTVRDLVSLIAHLEEQGVKMASERMIVPELKITWVHALDPDGIRVEFMQFFDRCEDVK
ncbi:MAG: VOC family protein [Subdoligranulum sp.]|nr:VOC family protein [Subdoligranulum sp.]